MSNAPAIIPQLYARQKQRGGYLTDTDLRSTADELSVPLYRVQALVSFFPHFRLEPPPAVEMHVCRDMSCHLRGSVGMTERLAKWAQQEHGQRVRICGVSCLGRCDRPIAASVNEQLYLGRSEEEYRQILSDFVRGSPPSPNTDWERSAAKVGTWQMDVDQGQPKYAAVHEYLRQADPERVLATLEHAGLLGMGGAGGRAYLKWGDVYRAVGTDKFIVCNADESEPGTFKDREILLVAPHLTLEGMILAGLVVGASRGWVYLRHEYHEQIERVQLEIERARSLQALGTNIFGSGRNFELDVFVSPGGYICGEQTALIEAMEDRRAEPRNRPPELMTNGYQNQPTLLSNVETFAWVPAIMQRSAGQWYAEQGRKSGPWVPSDQSSAMKGMRLFSISGDVHSPGVYEVPTGIPLGELIDKYCGGMAEGKEIVAVALSGPSGGLLPARIPVRQLNRRFVEANVPAGVTELDVREIPLDINVSRALGLMIGAGIVVYGTGADVLAEAMACSRFFRDESCGKCVPCRIGSHKITEIGHKLLAGDIPAEGWPATREIATQLAQVMTATSICGLGQVASNPVLSVLRFFPDAMDRGKAVQRPSGRGDGR